MENGSEIRLFDPRRKPRDWTGLLRPTDCAVFLKDRVTSASLAPDGQPFRDPDQTTCLIFDSLDAAQNYCDAKVRALPQLRCEIYDHQGLAQPPLLVVLHPDHAAKEEYGSFWARRRRLIIGALLLATGPLFWLGVHYSSDLPTFLAINCIFASLRLLYWEFGVKHSERERRKRLEGHRKAERGDA